MTRSFFALILVVGLFVALAAPAAAQDAPQRVEITAADGVTLVADWSVPGGAAEPRPAVILMHMLGSARGAFRSTLVPVLLDAGYATLSIDFRGHGQSGGKRGSPGDWDLTEEDVYAWLAWLRAQPGVDPERISLVGGSLGAVMALRVTGSDERVLTAVAISPFVEAQGVRTDDSVRAIGERPLFLVAGQEDSDPANSVRTLMALAEGDVQVRLYPNQAHGTGLLVVEKDLIPAIVAWLDAHN